MLPEYDGLFAGGRDGRRRIGADRPRRPSERETDDSRVGVPGCSALPTGLVAAAAGDDNSRRRSILHRSQATSALKATARDRTVHLKTNASGPLSASPDDTPIANATTSSTPKKVVIALKILSKSARLIFMRLSDALRPELAQRVSIGIRSGGSSGTVRRRRCGGRLVGAGPRPPERLADLVWHLDEPPDQRKRSIGSVHDSPNEPWMSKEGHVRLPRLCAPSGWRDLYRRGQCLRSSRGHPRRATLATAGAPSGTRRLRRQTPAAPPA